MADNDTSLFGRIREQVARLGPGEDGDPSPQARDERPTTVGREEFREETDDRRIGEFVREYNRNPLIRVPIQNFAADVTEPGVSVQVDLSDEMEDTPEVPADSYDQYAGMPLDDALESWLSTCHIDGWSYDGSFTALLENVVKDRRGRRGSSVVEHVYDDARERNRLMALRPIRTETLTFYTREGKRIVLREDDELGTFDTIAVDDYGGTDPYRDSAPETPAGKTAAAAQFDNIFAGGNSERDEIPFAYSDLSFSAYDSDTGSLLGRPDSATILNRAAALRKKLRHVDQSIANTAFGNILAKVETQQAEVVESVRDNLDVNIKERGVRDQNPQTVSATNAEVDVTEIEGQVPDVTEHIQQEIEFILTSMPTPLYRVGFAGDINRDVTAEQGEDYRDQVKRERRRLEDDFRRMLTMKARDLMYGTPHTEERLDVDVALRIRPSTSESPLRDEEFDPAEFSELMSGLSTAAGPKGGATAVIPEKYIIETFLDLDYDDVKPDTAGDEMPDMPTENAAVNEAFQDFQTRGAALATDSPFADIPVLPDGLKRLTPAWTRRWAEWIAAGRPSIPQSEQLAHVAQLDWNPALHPRDPETGQFVERSFNVPDDAPDAVQSGDPARMLRYISDVGGRSDVEDVLQDDGITVDGIPDDVSSKRGLVDYIDSTDAEDRLPPSMSVDEEGNDPMFDDEFTGTESVDLLDSDAPPSERRVKTDVRQRGEKIPTDVIKNKSVPVGEDIMVEEDGRFTSRTVEGYERNPDTPYPVISVGAGTVDPEDVDGIYRGAQRARAELSFDEWPERFTDKKEMIRDAFEQTVPKAQDSVVGRTIKPDDSQKTPEIDDETFESAADRIATVLADMNKTDAENVLARISSIGDDLDRAHAGDRVGENRPRSFMDISEGESQSTVKHELGHVMASSQGFGAVDAGASFDMDFYPASDGDIELSADGDPIQTSGLILANDPVEQFTVGYSNSDVSESFDIDPDSDESTSVGRSEWESQVRDEIPEEIPDLGARNFRNAGAEYLLEANEGDMIRAKGPQMFGRHLSITEIDDEPGASSEREFVAVAEDGDEYEFRVRDRFDDVYVDTKMMTDDMSRESVAFDVAGKRQSTPDAFGDSEPDTPSPDEVLGGEAADTSKERMREFVTAANKAWFRANLAANRHDRQLGMQFSVINGYSSTSAHETIAQTVEMMHTSRGRAQGEIDTTAARLVRNNPELIEKYRHIADIPDPMQTAINEQLKIVQADFRLGDD